MSKTENKKTKVDVGLSLWQKASVLMAALSFYTTKQGFENTVFVGSHPAWSLFASFSVQTILLVGVLLGFSIIRKLPGIKKATVILLWGSTAFVSIAFSYISIANSMYYTDFAVNGNQVLELFIRNTVQKLENQNKSEMESLRPELVRNLMEHGYNVMEADVKARAKTYISVTEKYADIEPFSALVDVERSYFSGTNEYMGDSSEPIRATREYIIAKHPDNYKNQKENGEFWADRVVETINGLNEVSFKSYEECCTRAQAVIDKYNGFREPIENGQMPTLESLNSLVSECDAIRAKLSSTIVDAKKREIRNETKKDGSGVYTNGTANAYVKGAVERLDALAGSVDNIKKTLQNFISNSYGDDNKSVDEILALIGNSSAELFELEKARDQMLTAQGSILQNMIKENAGNGTESDSENVSEMLLEVNELMTQLDTYVNKAAYVQSIATFKESYLVNAYNIVEESAQSQSEEDKNCQNVKTESEENGVKSVTPEEWTQERKIHMSRLAALVFDYPVYNNKNQESGNTVSEYGSEGSDKETESNMIQELAAGVYKKQKLFLDTSESEKAINLLLGSKENFPYKSKAVMAVLFAMFLDLGAAAVGYMIDVVNHAKKS